MSFRCLVDDTKAHLSPLSLHRSTMSLSRPVIASRRKWILVALWMALLCCSALSVLDVVVAQVPEEAKEATVFTDSSSSSSSQENEAPASKRGQKTKVQERGVVPPASSSSSSKAKQGSEGSDKDELGLDVIQLTSQNFASTITTTDVWLIEFYTPWCSHCQHFRRAYANVARTLHSSPEERIRVAKVDCSVEKALLTRFGIEGFPSFVLISGWNVYEFVDPRSEANLMKFARGGYKTQDPIPLMVSPMGPMGMLQGTLIYLGTNVMLLLEKVQLQYGISPVLAVMSFCMLGIFGGMISIVLLTICFTPKEKYD